MRSSQASIRGLGKMTNLFIIHGVGGHPEENWYPWLKSELEKLDYRVFIPKFPTPDNQSLENWTKVFEDYGQYLDEHSIVVGHSLGVTFLLSVLEDKQIKAAFFIAGFTTLLDNPQFDKINKTFIERDFNWDKIKQNCNKFHIFHSDNDPYIRLEKAEDLAKNLDTEVILVEDAGHFNAAAGYTQFNLLLEKINAKL